MICELCANFSKVTYKRLKEKIENNQVVLPCDSCEKKLNHNSKKEHCKSCKAGFYYSPFFYKSIGYSKPLNCLDCRKFINIKCINC